MELVVPAMPGFGTAGARMVARPSVVRAARFGDECALCALSFRFGFVCAGLRSGGVGAEPPTSAAFSGLCGSTFGGVGGGAPPLC